MKLIILSILVFALLGPLIGLATSIVVTNSYNLPSGMVLITYMVGGPMAIVAGLLFGIYLVTARSNARMLAWPALLMAGCICGGLSALLLSLIFLGQPLDLKLFVTLGTVAGGVCAMVFKALLEKMNSA